MTASAVGSGAVPGPRDADDEEPITGRAGLVRNVRVGRQGIYRADRSLVAYELLFRDSRPSWLAMLDRMRFASSTPW